MSEENKPQRVYEAVFGATLDECANRLNDSVNKLIERGYEVSVEPKDYPSGKGFGYMLHGDLSRSRQPQFTMVQLTPEQLEQLRDRAMGSSGISSVLSDKSKKLMAIIFSKLSMPEWDIAEKEVKDVLPGIIHTYPSTDIRQMVGEFDAAVKKHDEEHPDSSGTCPTHRTLAIVVQMLQDHLRLSLQ